MASALPEQQQQQILLHNQFASPSTAACIVKPCKELSEDAKQLLSGRLDVFGTWSFVPPTGTAAGMLPLSVLHVLAGDAGPDFRLLPDPNAEDQSARAAFEQWHQADLPAGRCIVVRYTTCDKELVLVPLLVKTGAKQPPTPVYWGFTVPANLLPLTARALNAAKLLVVFDIDETLLTACTVDSLLARLRRVKAARDDKAAAVQSAEAEGGGDPQQLQLLQAEVAALQAEEELLQTDFELLSFFRQDADCRTLLDDQYIEPSWETCRTSWGGEVTRPVVRLELGGRPVILTRINPDVRNTSLIIRPRPGWTTLRDYMSGLEDLRAMGAKKERWEVYICTTAEREYAWEAWRLLDPDGSLFPLADLAWRMLCVTSPQKKDLLNVLRKADIDAAQAAGHAARCPSDLQYISDKDRALRPPRSLPAPLSVIIDDRLDVWEEASRKAVLQVMPFHPHKEAAAMELGPDAAPAPLYQATVDSEVELTRVMATLKDIRSKIYQALDMDIKPEVARLVSTGMSEQLQRSTEAILGQVLVPVKSIPQLLAESPFPPPAALAGPDRDQDRASDLRLLMNDPTMAASASAPGPGQQPDSAGAQPSDPRKRRLAAAGNSEDAAAAGGAAAAGSTGAAGDQPAADQQQQQPHAKKHKKEKKVKLDVAGLLQALQQQQQQGQAADAPASASAAAAAAVAPTNAAPAAGAAAGDADDELLLLDSDDGGTHGPAAAGPPQPLPYVLGGYSVPQQQQQQQHPMGGVGGYSFVQHGTGQYQQQQQQQQQQHPGLSAGLSGPPSGSSGLAGLAAVLQSLQPGLPGPPGAGQPGAGGYMPPQQQQQQQQRQPQQQRPMMLQQPPPPPPRRPRPQQQGQAAGAPQQQPMVVQWQQPSGMLLPGMQQQPGGMLLPGMQQQPGAAQPMVGLDGLVWLQQPAPPSNSGLQQLQQQQANSSGILVMPGLVAPAPGVAQQQQPLHQDQQAPRPPGQQGQGQQQQHPGQGQKKKKKKRTAQQQEKWRSQLKQQARQQWQQQRRQQQRQQPQGGRQDGQQQPN